MKNGSLLATGGSALLLSLLIIVLPWYLLQLAAGLLLLAFLPGYALLIALWPHPADPQLSSLERWLLAVPLSCSLTIVILLALVFAHAPLNIFVVVGSLGGITILFSLLAWQRTAKLALARRQLSVDSPLPYSLSPIPYSLLLILLLALFRIPTSTTPIIKATKPILLLRAVSLVYGHTEAILTHSKGPAKSIPTPSAR
ncbi:MAG: DUF1616 domain-containing protein [Anaerolineae bacterium]